MLKRIHIRARLTVWRLRLILGVVLLTFSEVVMWQNPLVHTPLEWAARSVLYVALAAILIDVTVRFQANEIASLALVSGLYGLLSASIVSHTALTALPISLIVRGMGLQTGAGLYGLLFFILVLRGRQLEPRDIAGAISIGALWGIWLKWYPIQQNVAWGDVPIETATLYAVVAFIIIGALLLIVAPRFVVVREPELQLQWWEWIVVGIPLFIALFVGLLDETVIPAIPLVVVAVVVGAIIGALALHKHGVEPSALAQILFVAPNAQTYVALSFAFILTGTLSASLITNADSPIGVGVYLLIVAVGSLWLPAAFALVGLRAYQREE